MTTRRRYSRGGNVVKQAGRGELEQKLAKAVEDIIAEFDPTIRKSALRVAAKLASRSASRIAVQTQAVQRALPAVDGSLDHLCDEFVSRVIKNALDQFDPKLSRFRVAPPPSSPLNPLPSPQMVPDAWAGPVAGPTVIERHYGIARSTLFRWQKRNEAIALKTGSRKYVFPLDQFVDARPADGISTLIAIFNDQRLAWQWLVSPNAEFDGSPPLDVLLNGGTKRVIESACLLVAGGGS